MEAGSHSFSSPFSAAALTAEGRAGRRPNISHHMNPAHWNMLPVKVWIDIMKRDLAQLGRNWSLNREKNYKFTAKASAGWQNAFYWLVGVGIVNRVKTSMVRMVDWSYSKCKVTITTLGTMVFSGSIIQTSHSLNILNKGMTHHVGYTVCRNIFFHEVHSLC